MCTLVPSTGPPSSLRSLRGPVHHSTTAPHHWPAVPPNNSEAAPRLPVCLHLADWLGVTGGDNESNNTRPSYCVMRLDGIGCYVMEAGLPLGAAAAKSTRGAQEWDDMDG